MSNLVRGIRKSRSSRIVARHRVILLSIACATLFPSVLAAQGSVRLGIGTFLSHDRGWNYSEPIEFFATVARKTGSVDLEAGAAFSKSFAQFSQPAVDPRAPSAYRDGFHARLGLRAPSTSRSFVSALIGAELFHNRTEGQGRATTVGGSAGLGLNFGSERRGSIDLRYVRFAKRLGSSRGILPLTLAWQL
jgi:hypothetical protein